ncbi:MAG: LTA synthase family protein [Alphaproteobacteria bacterium]|nr:LTA synthase family protein [Alphaproteobacteria bacterium]
MTGAALSLSAGAAAAAAAWLIPRRVAGARMAVPPSILLDLMPVVLTAGLLLIISARPLFSGAVVLALGGGFAFADRTKRRVLREPVVFSDMSEFGHLFTQPHLYLPFAGPALVIGGALAAIGTALGLLAFTTPLWQPAPAPILIVLLIAHIAGWLLSREPLLSLTAIWLRRLRPIGDPVVDAARLGPFCVLLVYGIIARAERAGRRTPFHPLPAPMLRDRRAAMPVVLVQCESFFDARRISPSMPKDLLPGFEACLRRGATFGRLETAAWGANTMRTEFAVLTGIAEERLGYDRFNPYHAFARAPIASLASQLRAEGYRTLCLHPFDRRFFRRDLTMRALGFDAFLGRETLGGSRRPPYRSDPDLARQVLTILDAEGPRTFIFVITMGNHGPWPEDESQIDPELRRLFGLGDFPQGGALLHYLTGLTHSDEMLGILLEELGARRDNAVLGFYGDHLPSLPDAFEHLGFDDWASDYILVDGTVSRPRRLDLAAHMLPRLILDRLRIRNLLGRSSRAPVLTR